MKTVIFYLTKTVTLSFSITYYFFEMAHFLCSNFFEIRKNGASRGRPSFDGGRNICCFCPFLKVYKFFLCFLLNTILFSCQPTRKMMVILLLVLPFVSAKLLSKIYKPEQLVVFGQGKLSNLITRKIKFN